LFVVNGQMGKGRTSQYKEKILEAAEQGNIQLAKLYVQKAGKNILWLSDENGKNALHRACEHGQERYARWIVETEPALLNKQTRKGLTALDICMELNQRGIAEMLAAVGAEIHERNLVMALKKGYLKVLQVWCAKGKESYLECLDGSFLDFSIRNRQKRVAEWLVRECFSIPTTKNVRVAAREGYLEVVKAWVNRSASGTTLIVDDQGSTLPHLASESGQAKVLSWLVLTAKQDPNMKNHLGWCPLDCALVGRRETCVKVLVGLDHLTIDTRTAVRAAKAGSVEVIQRWIKLERIKGQNMKSIDLVMHAACESGHENIAKFLIANGKHSKTKKMILSDAQRELLIQSGFIGTLVGAMKTNPNSMQRAQFAKHFAGQMGKHSCNVALANVQFLRPSILRKINSIPSFNECSKNDWLSTGELIQDGDVVLFLSHRWETITHPDPFKKQINLIIQFLWEYERTNGRSIDWVWLDYSCVPKPKKPASKQLEQWHHSILPAVLVSSVFLVLPRIITEQKENTYYQVSDLQDYTSRGWCRVEFILALLSGAEIYIVFRANERVIFQSTKESPNIFDIAAQKAMEKIPSGKRYERQFSIAGGWDHRQVFRSVVAALRRCNETDFLSVLSMTVKAPAPVEGNQKSSTNPEFNLLYHTLGEVAEQSDKIVLLNMLLCMTAFIIGDIEGGLTPPSPSQMFWSKNIFQRCLCPQLELEVDEQNPKLQALYYGPEYYLEARKDKQEEEKRRNLRRRSAPAFAAAWSNAKERISSFRKDAMTRRSSI